MFCKILCNTWVSQKFCNILVTYLLYSSNCNKSISSRDQRVADFEANFQSVLWSNIDISSNSLRRRIPPLGCWSVASELWIGTSNNPGMLDPDYLLRVASVWVSKTLRFFFRKLAPTYPNIAKLLTHPRASIREGNMHII